MWEVCGKQAVPWADLATLLWWHRGLPGLDLPFHTSPTSGVKGQRLQAVERDQQANSLLLHSYPPMVPVASHSLVMLGTRHGSDPALPCPALPQAVRGRKKKKK